MFFGKAQGADLLIGTIGLLLVGLLLLPLPPFLLDLLLISLLSTALLTLFISFYARDSVEFSTYPSLLLLVTVARVVVTIAATRNILTDGSAGALVEALGTVLLGGNFAVGLVLFSILSLAQFMVITGGTSRISEVTARFTLDALPGKQMSIDAELNAGLIQEDQARARRKAIQEEADFYGSMDGASKFVRGESIAALIIILVNIVGGVVVGTVQKDMPIWDALQRYCTLSVGLGLAIQISALLTSVAAGILVTRVAGQENLGLQLGLQLLSRQKPLFLVSIMLGGLMFLSGSPKIALLVAAVGIVSAAVLAREEESSQTQVPAEEEAAPTVLPPATPEEQASGLLGVDVLRVEVGYSLITLVASERSGFMRRVDAVRRSIAEELGLILPAVHVKDNLELAAQGYSIKIKENEVARGELQPHFLLAINAGTVTRVVAGQATMDPAFGMPALWINPGIEKEAEAAGYSVVEPVAVLGTHLAEVVRSHSDELLTRQQVRTLVDNVKKTHPAVVEELVPAILSLGEVQRVLQALLRERVSIRDLSTILEALADQGRINKDPLLLISKVRRALSRTITRAALSGAETLSAVTLAPALERRLVESLHPGTDGIVIALSLPQARAVVDAVAAQLRPAGLDADVPALLTSGELRAPLWSLVHRSMPAACVLSYEEVSPGTNLNFIGEIAAPFAANGQS
ncbi:MAG: EscV/YscV/HrcV family type III secretion system export apparatus protein [Elusimicrobia bacterium]|nr:MAG: EscV/YscV/HrcV family type III secretion system export apparatus protein [Elusimicrobiota bacterium]